MTKHPDREALVALSHLYEMDYGELASAFIAANYGRDLLRQGSTGQMDLPQHGESDDPASARVQQERNRQTNDQNRKRRDAAIAEEIRTVIRRLTDMAATLMEDRAPASAKTSRGRRHRKTG